MLILNHSDSVLILSHSDSVLILSHSLIQCCCVLLLVLSQLFEMEHSRLETAFWVQVGTLEKNIVGVLSLPVFRHVCV